MSVLNKIPYISALLNSLTAEQLQTLTNLMNGSGDRTPLRRTVNPNADSSCPHIASGDKGVHMCALTYNYIVFNGYLVYSDDYCALISYTDSTVLKVFDIDVSNVGIATVDEAINVLELRTVVWETIHKNGGGGGTEVIANPELEGDENALNSIEINGVKYKVEGSGSGGSVDTSNILKNYAETLTLKDNNGDTICSIHRVLALKTTSWYFGALNSEIQSVASQLSLSVPTITDTNTMQTALSTIMTALQTYGYGSQISGMISTFLTEFDFVLKQRVSNPYTESYPLFMTGENSAYIMSNGSFSSLFTAFDITDAYTVDYYMQEVNVTD